MKALVIDGRVERAVTAPGPFRTPDGMRHPASAWTCWTAEDWRRAYGPTAQVVPLDAWGGAVPPGMRLRGTRIRFDAAAVRAIEEPILVELEVEAARRCRLQLLAERRWRQETAGIDVAGGRIGTDARTAAALAVARAAGVPTAWKLANGRFADLSAAEVDALCQAVAGHVRACFARERALADRIRAAATAQAVLAVDIESGWPGAPAPDRERAGKADGDG